ncbi:Probable zinc transporter 10 [Linum perenne]
MAASPSSNTHFSILTTLLILLTAASDASAAEDSQCGAETASGCNDKSGALSLKLIATFSILVASVIGVCIPLFTRSVPALNPERSLFVIVKAFASGIILATGFTHVLPDSFDMLSSSCLADNPWHKFPFTGFVAMLSALATLLVDSVATSFYSNKLRKVAAGNGVDHSGRRGVLPVDEGDREVGNVVVVEEHVHHGHHHGMKVASGDEKGQQLMRYRVVAMVLELGIVVHSVVIGLSLGASNNTCTIKGLVAALCFHQMFEGMGLGGCILQAEYTLVKKAIMAFFFATTTPFGILVGIGMSKTYKENSPTALITVGLLNASSAGLLIYMALVDLLAVEFMGPKLQASIRLQIKSFVAVLLGAGGMSVMAKWA